MPQVQLPSSYGGEFVAELKRISAGRPSDAWAVEGDIAIPFNPSFVPLHTLYAQGIPSQGQPISVAFMEGRDTSPAIAAVKKLYLLQNPTAGETRTIGDKTYTFVTGTPDTDEIAIGQTLSNTITNFVNKINADTADTHATATNSNNSITLIGTVAGGDFTVGASNGTFIVETVVAAQAALTGKKARFVIQVVGERFIAGTGNRITLALNFKRGAGDTTGRTVLTSFIVDTPLFESNLNSFQRRALLAQYLKNLLVMGLNNYELPQGYRIVPNDRSIGRTQVADALTSLFGSSTAFMVNGDSLVLEAGAEGAAGNFIGVEVATRNSRPSPLLGLNELFVPQVPGIIYHLGLQTGLDATIDVQKQEVDAANYKYKAGSIPTGGGINLTTKLIQDLNPKFAEFGIANATFIEGDKDEVLLLAGDRTIKRFTLISVWQSTDVIGGADVSVFYKVEAGGGSLKGGKNQLDGIDLQLTANAISGRPGDPFGYSSFVRTI